MGMNASDYGGGIPLIDLWRKDAGLAIGHTEETPKLVSLPIDYDRDAAAADLSIQYEFPQPTQLASGDTLTTFETFVSVHQKDCFTTLRNYGSYMQTKGIRSASPEPAAYEPVWCAWGYERNFTLGQVLGTLPKVKALGIKWVGLDDGFQQANGDWHSNAQHFPGGDAQMKAFVDSIPIGRPGLPEDQANATAFLLSQEASFISGVVLFVDGGHDAFFRPNNF